MPTRLVALLLLLAVGVAGCATPGGGEKGPEARPLSERMDDRRLAAAIRAGVIQDAELRFDGNITVTVHDGIVLLTGEVRDSELAERAARMAREREGTRRVYNELEVDDFSSVFARIRDRTIAMRARSQVRSLDPAERPHPSRVRLHVERQRLYLLGTLTTEQRDAVTDTLRRVGGIEEVIRMIQRAD